MSTRRPVVADRRAVTRLSAALLTCVLALTLTAITRSHSGQHHLARAKAVVGVSATDVQQVATRSDQHAVADLASASDTARGVRASGSDPINLVDARSVETPRVRGPPGRAA
jgi:hypothetical protein